MGWLDTVHMLGKSDSILILDSTDDVSIGPKVSIGDNQTRHV